MRFFSPPPMKPIHWPEGRDAFDLAPVFVFSGGAGWFSFWILFIEEFLQFFGRLFEYFFIFLGEFEL